jgi:hypothetical protein
MDVVLPDVAPLEADLTYSERPVKILDQKDHVTWCKAIKFFKVQWTNLIEEEATWESEEFLCLAIGISPCHSYGVCDCSLPLLGSFLHSNLRKRFLVRGAEGCNTPSESASRLHCVFQCLNDKMIKELMKIC